MTEQELHDRIVHLAEEMDEQHLVLSAGLPKDAEGFVIADGSDLSDALKAIQNASSVLTRVAYKISREGLQ